MIGDSTNMLKKIAFVGSAIFLVSCSTTEFRQERGVCQSIWMKKIAPRYEQEMYNRSMSRQVPTGRTNCITNGFGNYAYTTCNDIMKTEYYTVPSVRTVDRNQSRRDTKLLPVLSLNAFRNMEMRNVNLSDDLMSAEATSVDTPRTF